MATAIASGCSSILALRILENEPEAVGGVRGTLQSRVLGETREYVVHLPDGYAAQPTARFPVLFALDGVSQSGHTAESAALLARIGVVPAMIVVGVPSVDGETRNRDYTPPDMRLDTETEGGPRGAADRFLTFLETELIPHVEQAFRTARPRMLAGWSRGGLFVVHSQLAAPSLFDARFAHSPALWRESDLIVTRAAEVLAAGRVPDGFLYLSLGDGENEKMRAAFEHMIEVLERQPPGALRWRADVTAGAVHDTNPRLATPVGLCAVFSRGTDRTCGSR